MCCEMIFDVMIAELNSTIVSGIFGLGWFATLTALYRDRSAAKQKVMEFLMARRLELDTRPNLLKAVAFLKQESEAKRRSSPLPAIPDGLNGYDLRELPGFLEPIGTFLEYNPATFRKAYGFFSEEVLLCAESFQLWTDGDVRYDQSIYWRSFSRFVLATKKRGYAL